MAKARILTANAASPAHGWSIVVLAAGLGQRFGTEGHKALVPLCAGEGSLQRLLRQLVVLAPCWPVTVVVGHRYNQVEAAVRPFSPQVSCLGGPDLAAGSPLLSLAAALATFAGDPHRKGVLVLFADTLLHPQALVQLLASATGQTLLVASQPAGSESGDAPIGLQLEPTTQRLIQLGPDVPFTHGVMAPAVLWPRQTWGAVAEAADRGLHFQWQVLRKLLAAGQLHAQVLHLAGGHMPDIDTPTDWRAARRTLLSPWMVSAFRRTISKEERNLIEPDRLEGTAFLKVCESPSQAANERSALQWLSAGAGLGAVPVVLGLRDRTLELEPVRGIRLYDLLRLLRVLGEQSPDRAAQSSAAALVLLHRSLEQLVLMQRCLLEWPSALQRPAYPLASHCAGLLAMLLASLGLPPLQPDECRELRELRRIWDAEDGLIPFRDATTKNIVVESPELGPHPGIAAEERLARLAVWLERGVCEQVRLVQIDWTSVTHLTAPEDDLFSLLTHAASLPTSERLLAQLVPGVAAWPQAVAELAGWIHPSIQPNPQRAARALLVRYLRFGGRKLLYRMLNPAAFAVRFRYDDPGFYFERLPAALMQLDPGIGVQFPLLMARLLQLRQAIALLPPWSSSEAVRDFYQASLGLAVPYWQESPLETQPLAWPAPALVRP